MVDIFTSLRAANAARLPLFKNSRGAVAHSKADGSDWTPLEWSGAVANAAKKLRRGDHDAGDPRVAGLVSAALYDLVRAALGVAALLGVDGLAEIVAAKFNAVSARVGVDVRIERDGSVSGGGLDAARGRVRSILYTRLDERNYDRASDAVDEIIAAVRQ